MNSGFVKDLLKYLPAQIVPGFVGLVSIPIVTRMFPPGEYGDYSLAAATVMILSTFFGWLPTSVIRYYPAYERNGQLAAFNATVLKLAGITLAGLTVLYYAPVLMLRRSMSAGLWQLLMIGGLLFIATCAFNLLQYFLRSQRLVGRFSAFAVWHSVGGFGLGIALILLLGLGIEGLLIGTAASIVLMLPLLWREALGTGVRIRLSDPLDRQAARGVFAYGMPLVVSNLAAWILSLSDRYVIGLFRDNSEVGLYSLSYNIADKSLMLLVTLFVMASGPVGVTIWENRGEQESKRFVAEVTRLYLLVCVPIVVGLSVLSKHVVDIMAGSEYESGHSVMPYVLFGVLLLGLEQRYQAGLLYHKRTSLITLATILAGLMNIALNVLFIPAYGYFAAAITTLVAYTAHLFLTIRFSKRVFVWKFPWRSLVNVVVASGLMAVVMYLGTSTTGLAPVVELVLYTLVGMAIYGVALLLLHEFSPRELARVRRTLGMVRGLRRAPTPAGKVDAGEVV